MATNGQKKSKIVFATYKTNKNIFPDKKIEPALSGANPSFPLINKKTKSDSFKSWAIAPKGKHVFHITRYMRTY
jgi:hypothetical protein